MDLEAYPPQLAFALLGPCDQDLIYDFRTCESSDGRTGEYLWYICAISALYLRYICGRSVQYRSGTRVSLPAVVDLILAASRGGNPSTSSVEVEARYNGDFCDTRSVLLFIKFLFVFKNIHDTYWIRLWTFTYKCGQLRSEESNKPLIYVHVKISVYIMYNVILFE